MRRVILTLPYLREVYEIEGDIRTGKIYRTKDGVTEETPWPAWALINLDDASIDNYDSDKKTGTVRVFFCGMEVRVPIATAPNGIKYAKKYPKEFSGALLNFPGLI